MVPHTSTATRADGVTTPSVDKAIRGFTLIELMIVVAVVAILAAIAYPSYTDSVLKSRRGQAKADMVEMAQVYERFHTERNTYVGAYDEGKILTQSPKTGTARYTFPEPAETQAGFVLTAVPVTGQDKDKCGTLTLDNTGKKTPTTAGCWQ